MNQSPKQINLGKDVLELLSVSMYLEPQTVFRELVQNSVDAIDDAIANGLLHSSDESNIKIDFNHIDRVVSITDNGIGIPNSQFEQIMLSLGASQKRSSNARGFRGVGRLSALGYCKKLVFRSRSAGDPEVMEIAWDGVKLKTLLADTSLDTDLLALISEITEIRRLQGENYPNHFTEVILENPLRLKNDIFMNEPEIYSYLSQVGPCPFSPEFSLGINILEQFRNHEQFSQNFSYNIFLGSADKQIFRPFRDNFDFSESKTSKLQKLDFFELTAQDGSLAALVWIADHDYLGSIPSPLGIKGLRARCGNLQIGNDQIFRSAFAEERFNSWCIGEVHIVDKNVKPNGRRDNFEHNVHYLNLVSQLRPVAQAISSKCRNASKIRNTKNRYEFNILKLEQLLPMLESELISNEFKSVYEQEAKSTILELSNLELLISSEEQIAKASQNYQSNIESLIKTGDTKKLKSLEDVSAKVLVETMVRLSSNKSQLLQLIEKSLDYINVDLK